MPTGATPANPAIFVSHSWHDQEETVRVVETLKGWGYTVWWDYDSLRGGQPIWTVVPQYIRRCDAFLVLLSKASLESPGVQQEISWAQHCTVTSDSGGRRLERFIPVVVKPCAFQDDLILSSRLYVTLGDRWEAGFGELKRALPPIETAASDAPSVEAPAGAGELSPEDSEQATLMALMGEARAQKKSGEWDDAVKVLSQVVATARMQENDRVRVEALFEFADLLSSRGEYDDARRRYQEAGKLAGALKDTAALAEAQRGLGWIDVQQERFSDAADMFNSAMALADQTGDRYLCAKIINNLGLIEKQQDRYARCRGALPRGHDPLRGTRGRGPAGARAGEHRRAVPASGPSRRGGGGVP